MKVHWKYLTYYTSVFPEVLGTIFADTFCQLQIAKGESNTDVQLYG